MIYETSSIPFLEKQLQEIDIILQGCKISNTYLSKRNQILRALRVKYMISKVRDHDHSISVMSRL